MLKKCSNCGGKILFSPKDRGNKCVNCGSVFAVPYEYKFEKKSFDESLKEEKAELTNSMDRINCNSCGATVLLDKLEAQTKCPYCGNSQIVKSNRARLMQIDSIIPFSFGKSEAHAKLKKEVKKRFYANKTIFKNITENDIQASYINAIVFDLSTSSSYSGTFSYTVERENSDGEKVRITRTRKVSGIYDRVFDNLTIEANSNLNQQELLSIVPFEYKSAVDFKTDFLNGYMLEYKDRMFDECFALAENMIRRQIEQELLKRHKCEEIEELELNIGYVDKKYNYCLLPVYFANSVVKEKKYTALINGQTGKVGSLPTNKWRVFLTIFLTCGFVVAMILLIAFLF